MAEVIRASGLRPEQVVVIAFNADVIEKTRKVMPELKAYWLTGYGYNEETKQWSPSLEQVLQTLERIDAHGLNTNAHTEVIDEDFVEALRENGYEFHAWTINDADLARRFHELGVDSITTDRPAYIRRALKFDAD